MFRLCLPPHSIIIRMNTELSCIRKHVTTNISLSLRYTDCKMHPVFQTCQKTSIMCVSELINYLRTMQRHCSLTGATQTNVNILVVCIKSSRTPLHVITTAHLEVPIMSLSLPLLSATGVNCATLAGSTLTKSPWHSEADLQHHFL